MDKLAQELELAREEFVPEWNAGRNARLYHGARQVGRRRVLARVKLGAALAAAAALLLVLVPRREQAAQSKPRELAHGVAHGEHGLRLADGSRAELVGEHSEMEVIDDVKNRIDLRLLSGHAHFEVVPSTTRSFVVQAHPYRVEVIGTIFDVERGEQGVSVSVQRGKVRVYGPRGAEDLVAGQIKRFPAVEATSITPKAAAADEPVLEEESAEEPAASEERPARHDERTRKRAVKHPAANASWRSLSQSGQYEAAFEWLSRGETVEDDPATLMDAADAARLSGHARNAVQYLARVVSGHKRSPVAPLAAFTLGRVYLDQLGQPDRAAQAFELARALAPSGSLAQDALAREVEAFSKGGNAHQAYVHAQEYLKRYPNGQRLRAVQLYGGLE